MGSHSTATATATASHRRRPRVIRRPVIPADPFGPYRGMTDEELLAKFTLSELRDLGCNCHSAATAADDDRVLDTSTSPDALLGLNSAPTQAAEPLRSTPVPREDIEPPSSIPTPLVAIPKQPTKRVRFQECPFQLRGAQRERDLTVRRARAEQRIELLQDSLDLLQDSLDLTDPEDH